MCETDGFSYCLAKDLYTEVNPEDEACSEFEDSKYRCRDCCLFDKGLCKADTGEYRYSDNDNEACKEFEYKHIIRK